MLALAGLYFPSQASAQATPTIPEPVYPGAEVINGVTGFVWKASTANAGIARYRVEISASAAFGTLAVQRDVVTPRYQLTAAERLAPGIWYWRVTAVDGAGNSVTSPSRSVLVVKPDVSYLLEVSTSSAITSPVVSQARIPSQVYTLRDWEQLGTNTTYYWRVTSRDAAGNTRVSTSTRSLLIADDFPPAAPTAVYPQQNIELLTKRPTLQWTSSPNATSFDVQVSDNASFTTTVYSATTTLGYVRIPTDLVRGRRYYWRVTARTATNRTTASTFTFVVKSAASVYELQVSEQSSFSALTVSQPEIANLTYMLQLHQALGVGISYYWRVIARDPAGNTRATTANVLRLSDTYPPLPASPVYPLDNSEVANPRPRIVWTTTSDAVAFNITVADNASLLNPIVNAAATTTGSYTLPTALTRGRAYYWRVRSADAAGNAVTSQTYLFRVLADPIEYRLDVARDTAFTSIVASEPDIARSPYTLRPSQQLPDSGTYYWRVTSLDGAGNARVSTQSFQMQLADAYPPDPVVLLFPENDEGLIGPKPGFVWSAAQDVSSPVTYRLQVSASSAFGTLLIDRNGLTAPRYQAITAEALPPGGYFWRVLARDAQGNTSTSTIQTFRVLPRQMQYRLQVATDAAFTALSVDRREIAAPTYTLNLGEALREATPYRWRVVASDEAGNTRTSQSVYNLALADNFPPSLPEPVYPAEGGEIINTRPCFQWTSSQDTNGVRYWLEVSQSVNFTLLVGQADNLATPGGCISTTLLRSGAYFWRVRVQDSRGNAAATRPFAFRVGPAAVAYRIELGTDAGLSTVLYTEGNITGLSHTLPPQAALQDGRTYYWRVTATDPAGHTRRSTSTFTMPLADSFAPTEVVGVFPAVDASVLNPQTSFGWTGGDDPSGATYRLQIAPDQTFLGPIVDVANLTRKAYALTAAQRLTPGTTYFWRIIATDGRGNTRTNTGMRFFIAPRAATYDLAVKNQMGAEVLRYDRLTVLTQTPSPAEGLRLVEGQSYTWQVTARDPAGNTRLSPTFTFSLADIFAPPLPELVYPADAAEVANARVGFKWNAVTDPNQVRYAVELSPTADFASPTRVANNLTTQGYVLTTAQALARGQDWYWRVTVSDTLGNAASTPPRKFRVTPNAVSYTLLVTPQVMGPTPLARAGLTENQYTVRGSEQLVDGVRYNWNVTAQDPAGNTRTSASTWSLMLADRYAPPLPIPEYPLANAVVINPHVDFRWTSVQDPNGVTYGLQVSTAADFSTTLVNVTGLTSTTYAMPAMMRLPSGPLFWRILVRDNLGNAGMTAAIPLTVKPRSMDYLLEVAADVGPTPFNLPLLARTVRTVNQYVPLISEGFNEGNYIWRVTAVDEADNRRMSGTSRFFLTDQFPPALPELIYPQEASAIINPLVSYAWTSVRDSGNSAVTYKLEVANNRAFTNPILVKTGLTRSAYASLFTERLAVGGPYYWRVTAMDANGYAVTTRENQFSVNAQRVTYDVLVAKDAQFTQVAHRQQNLSAVVHTVPPWDELSDGVRYYWKVTAYDSARNATDCRTPFSFLMVDVFPPTQATLLYPRNGDVLVNNDVAFTWARVQDSSAVTYTIEISDVADFSNIVRTAQTGDVPMWRATGTDALTRNKNYWWRVKATDARNNTSISAVNVFGVGPRDVRYTLEVATDAAFTSVARSYTDLRTNRQTIPLNDNLAMNTNYWWRVQAVDNLGRTTQSRQTWQFNITRLAQVTPGGLMGTYYDGVQFDVEKLRRVDPVIDFPARADGNGLGDFDTGIGPDTFSVRWEGWVLADRNETYTFYATSDDGQRLWVDGTQLVDSWTAGGARAAQGAISLTAGWHAIQYEMFENLAGAFARLEYASASTSRRVIPSDHLAVVGDPNDTTPPSIVDVYVAAATPNAAFVHVTANELTQVTIRYGATSSYGLTATGMNLLVDHDVTLPNAPAGTFHYQVELRDLSGNIVRSADIVACTPLASELTASSIRQAVYTGTAFNQKVLDRRVTDVDLRMPIGSLATNMSVRWSGLLMVDAAADITFIGTADDGQRLHLDGLRAMNDWAGHTVAEAQVTRTMAQGWHALTYEMYQVDNALRGSLEWRAPAIPRALIPSAKLAALPASFYAPVVGTPATLPATEATSPAGASVALTAPTVTDCRDPRPTVVNNAPQVFPLGGSTVTWFGRNRFGEETAVTQLVRVVDTTAPVLDAGPDLTVACDSPTGDGRTPKSRIAFNTPQITDRADPNPRVADDAPATLPLGTTTVTVTATDGSGNASTDSYTVRIIDSGTIVIQPTPDLAVPQANDCTMSNGQPGTRVTLRAPDARGACFAQDGITLTHNYPSAGSTSLTVCLPSGTTDIVWSAQSTGGARGTWTQHVSVVLTDFTVIVDNVTRGFVNTQGTMAAHVTGTYQEPITWEIRSSTAPTARSTDGTPTLTAQFANEGVYCPLNVLAVDNQGRRGLTVDACFGVDKTPPRTALALPRAWVADDDPAQPVVTNGTRPATYPHVFTGEDIQLAQRIYDIDGPASSGVAFASLTLVKLADMPPTSRELSQQTYMAGSGELPAGPMAADFAGCSTSTPCAGTKLDLAAVGRGPHAIEAVVRDLAGNQTRETFYMSVKDFKDALDHSARWMAALETSPNTPSSATEPLTTARGMLETAGRLHLESPGHGFLLAKNAWDLFQEAESYGAALGMAHAYIPRGMKSEARRVVEVSAGGNQSDWSLLGPSGNYMESPHFRAEYTVRPADRLSTGLGLANRADTAWEQMDYAAAITMSRASLQSVSVMFDDRNLATLFGTGVHYIDGTEPERYFQGSSPTAMGVLIGKTVAARIARVDDDPGVPPAVRAPLGRARTQLALFANGVSRVGTPGFTNLNMMTDVYLNAQKTLEDLDAIQRSAFDTHDWLTGMALTLTYVLNFSLYEGPTALHKLTREANPTGSFPYLDVAECRYHKAVQGLAQGRVQEMVASYVDSRCLLVDMYNRYYGGNQLVPGDQCLNPADYGCPVNLMAPRGPGGCIQVARTWDPVVECQ